MYKRLLALLIFVPMFLIAWYARNQRATVGPNEGPSVSTRTEPSRDSYQSRHDDPSRGERRDSRRERRENRQGPHAADKPGAFDFYLLNLSWSPEFCSTHPGKPECAVSLGFVLHGLWPQNNDGTYPEHCSNAAGPADPAAFRDILPDAGLLQHEWSTHGTCSGLAPDTYFANARSAFRAVRIPSTLSGLTQETVSTPEEILTQIARANPSIPRESLALSCGNNTLTAVEVCLDHDLHAVACSNVRSCRANSVRLVPPGASTQERGSVF
jgi:ribonuclease T2